LSVGLLGVFRVAGVDNRTWSELGPAGRGLASFLFAYPGRPHRRERLADLFWPELDAERARRALNSAIWRMRKLLASEPGSAGGRNLLTIGTETILARPGSISMRQPCRRPRRWRLRQPETLLDHNTLNHVAAVLHGYEGPFLDDGDDDWILGERERLHSLFLRTATMVVCRLGAAGLTTMQSPWRGERCGSIPIGKNWCATC
jgi:DNA-binding SARP family transcriptional activator